MKKEGKRKTKFFITAAILSFVACTAALVYKAKRRRRLHKISKAYWQ